MSDLDSFYQWLEERNPGQEEFIQAVKEVVCDVHGLVEDEERYQNWNILERLTEPDRIISFRVTWQDDDGRIRVNRGWRVQYCGVIGPYKGGLRFHPSVNESILKFLGFEQTFKNALTTLPMGGAKGGSDFDPRNCSDGEIMRFCQAFMNELYRHIGENTDIPAGDINVSSREIGYLFGQYRRLANSFSGTLTGKDIEFGGSHVRLEATGYGLVYFISEMLKQDDEELKDKTIAISGAGNVALHAAKKAIQMGGKVITLSSSKGYLYVEQGLEEYHINELIERQGKCYSDSTELLKSINGDSNAKWHDDKTPWEVECDIALPCATQNELKLDDAKKLVKNKVKYVAEGSNMPCTQDAIDCFEESSIKHAPGKASNAGGVALSGFEMAQNASFTPMGYDDLDEKLKAIMTNIHTQCCEEGQQDNGFIHYRKGANLAAFKRVADAIVSQGVG
ncbi:NADP-specific glutamate dehydrogenase [Bermanella marisrubri]|uniref:Glutamate dehydrogenase n=1 Tax=Bermanella marisrubri TaxID=207949 RepID=Q1N3D2_9GAMM|nr:NADP-specific glutamate dehydrogenase [Bermanella marisrubri]EAT12659.1 Glutamate dehydrogenase [Oceanobacter sp. RED65] [Bermanella marisrubri]QIZ85216.1 NADP-specific glutamate dehydrogenase [Bermanella marisrubri]